MRTGMRKKPHSAEYKFRVAIEAIKGEKTTAELCHEYGIKLLPAVKNIKQRFVRRDRLYCTYHFSA
jgi:transposase-like protein